jgi:hypothetical protein
MVVRWFRPIAVFVILAAGFALWPSPARAAIHELKLDLWASTWNGSTTGASGSHTSTFLGLDYRYTGASNWGFHLKGDFAGESGWSGPLFAGATSGNDSVWSGDVFYALPLPMATIRPFLGLGGMGFSTTFGGVTQTLTTTGFRFGADASIPLPSTPLSVNASVAFYPSNNNSFNNGAGVTTTATGNATDWSVTVQYNFLMGWEAEVGYRDINRSWGQVAGNCPCSDSWTGPIFVVGKRW